VTRQPIEDLRLFVRSLCLDTLMTLPLVPKHAFVLQPLGKNRDLDVGKGLLSLRIGLLLFN
jgi:hypothetical protein